MTKLNIDIKYFGQMADTFLLNEKQLKNNSNTEAPLLDLKITICNDIISTTI